MASTFENDDKFSHSGNLMSICRSDYIALSQDPLADFPRLVHVHSCPDVTVPSFPFGPLLRDIGVCEELLPLRCAFCARTTYQHCRNTYRVAHTGADFAGRRPEICAHQELAVLVECAYCSAPSDFHLQLAMFKEYYEEVFDMVRGGRVTLFDLRRSVAAVSFWPPTSGGALGYRMSRVASQVSEALCMDTVVPPVVSSLVMEYWQGVAHDFMMPDSPFTSGWQMYNCAHAWPCANNETFTRPCLWLRWSQHWLHELQVCEVLYSRRGMPFVLPRTWESWVDDRRPDWIAQDHAITSDWGDLGSLALETYGGGPCGRYDNFSDGDAFLKMATHHYMLGPELLNPSPPFSKPEARRSDAWYSQ